MKKVVFIVIVVVVALRSRTAGGSTSKSTSISLSYQCLHALLASRLVAQPLMAKVTAVHAIMSAEKPMATVNRNMASSPFFSIVLTESKELFIKMMPPEIRQKLATSSVGGRLGKREVGGLM